MSWASIMHMDEKKGGRGFNRQKKPAMRPEKKPVQEKRIKICSLGMKDWWDGVKYRFPGAALRKNMPKKTR